MSDRLSRSIGARIRKRRQNPDLTSGPLTQEQLAAVMGVSQPTISDWELGRTLPSVPVLLQLVEVLELESLDDLVRDGADGAPLAEAAS